MNAAEWLGIIIVALLVASFVVGCVPAAQAATPTPTRTVTATLIPRTATQITVIQTRQATATPQPSATPEPVVEATETTERNAPVKENK